MFKNVVNKVNKQELKNNLEVSIVYNDEALDYIKNKKNTVIDLLKYNAEDGSLLSERQILEYIEVTLKHTGVMFEDSLKGL